MQSSEIRLAVVPLLPATVTQAGERTSQRFIEFFTAHIRNPNTRRAYGRAIGSFFRWCEERSIELDGIGAVTVAAYIEESTRSHSAPTAKLELAAIRACFDWLVMGQIIPINPAASVRGPKHSVKRGKTPVLKASEARLLLDSIDTATIIGLRDRALIALMAFSFARISAALGMRVCDYYTERMQRWFKLYEKGGKEHYVPAHPNAASYVDAYIQAAGIADDTWGPLFRSLDKERSLSTRPMTPGNALKMVKRRAREAGLKGRTCNHTFRATGITAYLENGGSLENAQRIANHEDLKTTQLYDRREDGATIHEVMKIAI
jgi:integrase/recombinase XerD